jgi:peptide/nickel transport system ATP-binding protein
LKGEQAVVTDERSKTLLQVENLKQYFPIQRGLLRRTVGYIKAVDDVTLSVERNSTVGLVGESGCGKTTLGRSILRLYEPTDGRVLYHSDTDDEPIDILRLDAKSMRRMRRKMQMVFQDPFSSLNERMTVMENVGEPLLVNGIASGDELEDRVAEMLEQVGLQKDYLRRYPHSFSGGQRQRLGIARALVVHPELIVADEPVSALDVSVQAQILNLLKDLQEKYQLTYIFISHDLGVVRYLSHRIAVMYVGGAVEMSDRDELLENPMHPYTEALLSAVPRAELGRKRDRIMLPDNLPDPSNLPSGCTFHPRCSYAQDECRVEKPPLVDAGGGHYVACHLADRLALRGVS